MSLNKEAIAWLFKNGETCAFKYCSLTVRKDPGGGGVPPMTLAALTLMRGDEHSEVIDTVANDLSNLGEFIITSLNLLGEDPTRTMTV
jgi:hypothetical protein